MRCSICDTPLTPYQEDICHTCEHEIDKVFRVDFDDLSDDSAVPIYQEAR
jgi:hypothetical protein